MQCYLSGIAAATLCTLTMCVHPLRWIRHKRYMHPVLCPLGAFSEHASRVLDSYIHLLFTVGAPPQWCAYSAQECHKQCIVLLEQPASHPYCWCNRWGRSPLHTVGVHKESSTREAHPEKPPNGHSTGGMSPLRRLQHCPRAQMTHVHCAALVVPLK